MADFLGQYKNNYEEVVKFEETQMSTIYSAYNIYQQRACYLKTISKEQMKKGDYDYLLEKINREEQLTQLCQCKNVIQLYQKFETELYYIFELEYCEKNIYEGIINKYGGMEGEGNRKFLRQIILDIAKGLKVMHEHGVMHRDIKPNNIFMTHFDEKDGERVAKLGDFGCSIFIQDNTFDSIGTILYAAPEILKNLEYNEKCDLWSLGVTLYELYFGLLPYGPSSNMNMNVIMDNIYADKFLLKKTKFPSLDILFHRLLKREQNERCSYDEFFKIVFDKYFMINDQAFLQNNPLYMNLYNQILLEEEPIYPDLEIKESDDPIEQNKINKQQIMTLVKGGTFPDIMSVPNGAISGVDEVFNNIIYYDENYEYQKEVHKDSDLFENKTPGAFILCTDIKSLELIEYEIVNQRKNDKNTIFNFITTGSACDKIMAFLNGRQNFKNCINKMCIYCCNLKKWSSLKNKYNIIYGVYNKQSDVVNFIKKFSSKDIKPFHITKLITYNDYINNYKSRHEKISQFYGNMSLAEYQKNLDEMINFINDQDKKKALIKTKNTLLKGFMTFEIKKDLEVLNKLIIKEYTKETFYGDLNRWLMNSKMNSYDTIAYFTSRLMYSLNTYGKENHMYYDKNQKILRRGIKLPYSNLLPYERAVGKIILLSSFTSTSELELTARNFSGRKNAKEQYKTKKIFSVIYIITNNHYNNWIPNGINVQEESAYKKEREILFQPFSFYIVKKVDINKEDYTADIYLVTIGKTEILEEKIKKGKKIMFNGNFKIMEAK